MTYLFRALENNYFRALSPQNKEDGEEDKTKLGIRRGRPPLKSTPPGTSRSLSKTPSSEGRSSSKNSRPADASALPNGDSKTIHVKSCVHILCDSVAKVQVWKLEGCGEQNHEAILCAFLSQVTETSLLPFLAHSCFFGKINGYVGFV